VAVTSLVRGIWRAVFSHLVSMYGSGSNCWGKLVSKFLKIIYGHGQTLCDILYGDLFCCIYLCITMLWCWCYLL